MKCQVHFTKKIRYKVLQENESLGYPGRWNRDKGKANETDEVQSRRSSILFFPEQRLEDYAYSDDNDQDREHGYVQTKDITHPESQGNNA